MIFKVKRTEQIHEHTPTNIDGLMMNNAFNRTQFQIATVLRTIDREP